MKLKKYFVYLDDGENCYKLAVPAIDEDHAKKFAEGNGEIISIKEVDFPIYTERVAIALENAGFTEHEKDFILRTLQRTGITE